MKSMIVVYEIDKRMKKNKKLFFLVFYRSNCTDILFIQKVNCLTSMQDKNMLIISAYLLLFHQWSQTVVQ